MSKNRRFVATMIATLLFCGVTSAQVEVAPPPHPTLDEVVKEYLRLELPLPPKDADLVQLAVEGETDFTLAFRTGPANKPAEQRFFVVGRPLHSSEEGQDYLRSLDIRAGPFSDDVIQRSDHGGVNRLSLAIIMKLRGRDDAARALYRSSLKQMEEPPILELKEFKYWLAQWSLMDRGDRKKAYRDMRPLAAELESEEFPKYVFAFKQLEKTLAPNMAQKGSTEWLINDLVNYWEDESDPFNEEGQASYFKLVEMGFDAVPALIDHFDDDRYTQARIRARHPGVVEAVGYYPLTVGQLSRNMVEWLSGLNDLDAAKARQWLMEAKKLGEMKHFRKLKRPDANVLRVIGVKYPKEFDNYHFRVYLSTPWLPVSIPSVLASRLTLKERIAFFEEYLGHDPAVMLEGLIRLDAATFQDRVSRFLKKQPDSYFRNMPLVLWSTDRRSWAESIAAFRTAEHNDRLIAVQAAGRVIPSKQAADSLREQRLRFLLAFIHDPDGDAAGTVGDHAAAQLGGLLGFRMKRDLEQSVRFDPSRGPLTRLLSRARMAQAATQELERLREP